MNDEESALYIWTHQRFVHALQNELRELKSNSLGQNDKDAEDRKRHEKEREELRLHILVDTASASDEQEMAWRKIQKERRKGWNRVSDCKRLMFAQHIDREGKRFFAEVCTRDLEGIVAKRKMGIYKDNGNSWLKIKNRKYSQAEGRHELLTRRFTADEK